MTTLTTSSLLDSVAADRGLYSLVHLNTATWLPEVTDLEARAVAAVAYVAARRSNVDRPEAREIARDAIHQSPEVTAAALAAHRAADDDRRRLEAEARAERDRAAAEKDAEFRRRFAVACDLNRHDLKSVLKAAMKHTEYSRWTGNGWKRHGSWSLSVTRDHAHMRLGKLDQASIDHAAELGNASSVVSAANEASYQALVSILGRRSWNRGGGSRYDVTADTPNNTKLVRLAKSIIGRKAVSPKKLMAIADTHARAWAVEQTGGWGRMTKFMGVVEKTKEGTLLNGVPAGLDSDLLLVCCPSTGQRYALMVPRVPARRRTVKNALKAVNGLDSAKIVAAS